MTTGAGGGGGTRFAAVRRAAGLCAGLVLVNVSLTFANVWPTLGVRFSRDLSAEAAAAVLLLAALRARCRRMPRAAVRWLAGGWLLLAAGRYVEVTVASLYGREVNLYWDLQHVPKVGAMFAFVADPWLKAGLAAGLVLVPPALYLAARLVWGSIAEALGRPVAGRALGGAAGAVLLLGLAQWGGVAPGRLRVAEPVSPAFFRELGELVYEASGAGLRDLGPPPALRSDLSRVAGADVFVVFLESYGAVSWDRAAFVEALAPARRRFEAAVGETGRRTASAFVESTTFGGESWLAHISLLSGTEVRDPAANVRLMAQERDTLVKLFSRRGHRTIAIMPGLLAGWPEGGFYGFDEIYDHARLDYRGPPFGWWDVNDQYALARVDAVELTAPERPPAFVFFATISTHAPFVPAPPYQDDWARVLTAAPYDTDALDRAWSAWADWTNLGPSYVEALRYAFANVGGYLRLRADRELVLVLVGDHQPPALVSGAGASWDVPVHVVTNRAEVLDRLVDGHGFAPGLTPRRPAVARMDGLLPVLLDAFGDDEPRASAARRSRGSSAAVGRGSPRPPASAAEHSAVRPRRRFSCRLCCALFFRGKPVSACQNTNAPVPSTMAGPSSARSSAAFSGRPVSVIGPFPGGAPAVPSSFPFRRRVFGLRRRRLEEPCRR